MRRTLLALSAALLATVGTTLLYVYVSSADARARAAISRVRVIVASEDLGVGTPVASLHVQYQDVPAYSQIPGALSDLRSVQGRTLGTRVFKGQQLIARMFDAGSIPGLQTGHLLVPATLNIWPGGGLVRAGSVVRVFNIVGGALHAVPNLTRSQAKVYSLDERGNVVFDAEDDETAIALGNAAARGPLYAMAVP